MAKAEKKSAVHPEAKGIALIGASFLLLLCLLSYKNAHAGQNWLGLIGYGVGLSLNYLLGLASYLLIFYMARWGWKLLSTKELGSSTPQHLFFSLFTLSSCMLLNLIAEHLPQLASAFESRIYSEVLLLDLPYLHETKRIYLGGAPLYGLYKDIPTYNLEHLLGDVGIFLTFSISALVSFMLWSDMPITPHIMTAKNWLTQKVAELKKSWQQKTEIPPAMPEIIEKKSPEEIEKNLSRRYPEPLYPKEEKKERAIAAQRVYNGDFKNYKLPPLSLLNTPKKMDMPSLKKDLKRQAEILEETLLSFGIEAKVGEIHSGPTITSFEVHPAIGVKVQKIKALENDIALNLQAKSLRIIAPIPGKAAVGVEIPSLFPQEVNFREVLSCYQNGGRKLQIPTLLGKTVAGENVFSDLAKMPHCIIAGATGSGKSVCINTLLLSILMNARPDEIKLLLVDPKKVELTPYMHLPHLIAPVITEAHGAYSALNWLVKEMLTRYDILKQLGQRNIQSFNARSINKELESSLSQPIPQRMSWIVAIIDEFADLMLASSSDLETPIARIAQMARAVGIHLVLATQRPSREVITGLIKANFPTRIAFKVASRINSQIILDETGAETLLGNGDMLFLPPGSSQLIRAQGAFVTDEEIARVVHFICEQAPPNYMISSFDHMKPEIDTAAALDEGRDNLLEMAKQIVIETGTASTTFLQRKLKIGYARAASLMDALEAQGIIGPQEGAKPRRILLGEQSE